MNAKTYQSIFLKTVAKIQQGQLVVELPDETHHFFGQTDPSSTPIILKINHSDFFKNVVLQGDIGLGESYILNHWSSNNIAGLLKLFIRNREHLLDAKTGWIATLMKNTLLGAERIRHRLNSNTKEKSVENIHAHYDLGNTFYESFLDSTMTYSAGFFHQPDTSLQEAQTEKYDRICRKLALKPHHHLLEIGSGWGGFSIHAAQTYGCKITTVTISQEQFDFAKAKISDLGLEDQIDVQFQDYRNINGKFDRIASVEMLEAVGHEHLKSYFAQCSKLLKSDGLLAIQVILSPDSRYKYYRDRVDYIRKHIFPGGHLPSFKSIYDTVSHNSNWDLYHMETFGTHYAETLRRWMDAFEKATKQRRRLGFDESFDRKWEFYFKYCEAGFDMRHIQVAQFVFGAPNNLEFKFENDESLRHSRSSSNVNSATSNPAEIAYL